jgi:hypothetical protein
MRLSTNAELIVLGVLILYIAFTPGIPVIRQFLSTSVGKAAGLVAIIYVWKYVSEPVALLLTVNFVRCAGMREYLVDMPPPSMSEKNCPEGYTLKEGTCKKEGSPDKPATVCADPNPKWDAKAEKCVPNDAVITVGTAGSTGSMVQTPTTPPATVDKFADYAGGVQPTEKKEPFVGGEFAPF